LFGSLPHRVAAAGHSLLFAVGAGPPHDGVRRARHLNLSHDFAGRPARSGRSTRSLAHRPQRERSGFCLLGRLLTALPSFRHPRARRRIWLLAEADSAPTPCAVEDDGELAGDSVPCLVAFQGHTLLPLDDCRAPGHDPAAHPLNPAPLSPAAWHQPIAGVRGSHAPSPSVLFSRFAREMVPAIKPQPQPAARDRIG
jgi:hypothetical protein